MNPIGFLQDARRDLDEIYRRLLRFEARHHAEYDFVLRYSPPAGAGPAGPRSSETESTRAGCLEFDSPSPRAILPARLPSRVGSAPGEAAQGSSASLSGRRPTPVS